MARNTSPKSDISNFLKSSGAAQKDVDKFISWCEMYRGTRTKAARYNAYTKWARLMKSCKPIKLQYGLRPKFTWPEDVKKYLRSVTGGKIVDDVSPAAAIQVTGEEFVKYVVKILKDI